MSAIDTSAKRKFMIMIIYHDIVSQKRIITYFNFPMTNDFTSTTKTYVFADKDTCIPLYSQGNIMITFPSGSDGCRTE